MLVACFAIATGKTRGSDTLPINVPDSFEDQQWVKLGVASALEKEYAKDQAFFVEMLAKTLLQTLPDEVQVKTRGVFKKTVYGVVLMLGDARYSFEKPEHGPVFAMKTKVVRGIALKSDEIDIAQALEEVGAALEARAAKSGEARNALEAALGLQWGRPGGSFGDDKG